MIFSEPSVMQPSHLARVFSDAGLATAAEADRLRRELDPSAGLLSRAAAILDRRRDELLDALLDDLAPRLPEARLVGRAFDPAAQAVVPDHDAWDFLVLPVAFDEDGTLTCVISHDTLSVALAYLLDQVPHPVRLERAEAGPLEQYIAERYRYEGISDAA